MTTDEIRSLWLDDERKTPQMFSHSAKTSDEAILHLLGPQFQFISLDHDLGYVRDHSTGEMREDTGYIVLQWMIENNVWPEYQLTVHSANYIRANAMVALAKDYAPEGLEIARVTDSEFYKYDK